MQRTGGRGCLILPLYGTHRSRVVWRAQETSGRLHIHNRNTSCLRLYRPSGSQVWPSAWRRPAVPLNWPSVDDNLSVKIWQSFRLLFSGRQMVQHCRQHSYIHLLIYRLHQVQTHQCRVWQGRRAHKVYLFSTPVRPRSRSRVVQMG